MVVFSDEGVFRLREWHGYRIRLWPIWDQAPLPHRNVWTNVWTAATTGISRVLLFPEGFSQHLTREARRLALCFPYPVVRFF